MSTRQEPQIDLAIQQSSRELKRLSELYKARGKTNEAQKIDETLARLSRRADEIEKDRLERQVSI